MNVGDLENTLTVNFNTPIIQSYVNKWEIGYDILKGDGYSILPFKTSCMEHSYHRQKILGYLQGR